MLCYDRREAAAGESSDGCPRDIRGHGRAHAHSPLFGNVSDGGGEHAGREDALPEAPEQKLLERLRGRREQRRYRKQQR